MIVSNPSIDTKTWSKSLSEGLIQLHASALSVLLESVRFVIGAGGVTSPGIGITTLNVTLALARTPCSFIANALRNTSPDGKLISSAPPYMMFAPLLIEYHTSVAFSVSISSRILLVL